MRLSERRRNLTRDIKRLGEETNSFLITQQVGKDFNSILSLRKLKRTSIPRGEEMVVRFNARFSHEKPAATD
jgi:hypothetical protein